MTNIYSKIKLTLASLLIIIGIGGIKTADAQFVTIPDANFVSFLTVNFPSCMTGNQMDTTCLMVTSVTNISMVGYSVSDLTGIQYFDNLNYLNANQNNLTGLPLLPPNLQTLSLYNNYLTSLPPLPSGLTYLNVQNNNLTSLPTLPSSLIQLTVSENDLTSLPALPPNLQLLNVSQNYFLVGLPPLPNTLLDLYMYSINPISLPISLPPTLNSINCDNTNVGILPTLPSTLTQLSANNSGLSYLPTLPPNLTTLLVNSNNLTTADVDTLPSTLTILWCSDNNILSLPAALPPNLVALDCGSNGLMALPVLPSTLQTLACQGGFLTSLPTLPSSLNFLNCSFNLITSIPPLPNHLFYNVILNNNPLNCLPILPDSIGNLTIDSTNITCIPNYPSSISWFDINPTNFPLCDVLSGCPIGYNITGKMYFDNNTDCSYQSGENMLMYMPIKLSQSGTLLAQNFSLYGHYSFDATLGNYDVEVDTTGLPFENVCLNPGLDTNITLTALDSIADNIDFGFKCKPGYDISVNSVYRSSGWFFPGQNVEVRANIGDVAMFFNNTSCNTSGVSGTVAITVSGPVTYTGPSLGSLTPSVSGSVFTYSISDFSLVNPYTAFGLQFSTDVSATLGDLVCFSTVITTSGTEYNLTNNNSNHCFLVVNSYDPNIKEVSPVADLNYPFNDWLTYTVHFQNTGNAPAMNIKILDVLDSDLDPSTFRLLNASHNVNTTVTGSNVEFLFNGIMLADSATNEPESHGYVQYKIMPNLNLSPGTIINNTADIYFDFNSPITTNTTINTVVNLSGLSEENEMIVNIFPNPVADFINIQIGNESTNRYVQVIDMMGKVVYQQLLPGLNNSVPTSTLSNGMYSLRIIDDMLEVNKKIIITH